jgi:hypothetical protein
MRNMKLIVIATTIAILAVATISVALAHTYGGSQYYDGMMGYSTTNTDDNWWNEMLEHMEEHWNEMGDEDWWTNMRGYMNDHWDEVQEEEWFNEMRAFMDQHIEDVQNQEWFNEMAQFMEDQRYENRYRFDSSYGYGYHGCH